VRRRKLGGRLGQRQLQHPIPQLLGQRGGLARPRQILQSGQAALGIATTPGHHRALGAADDRGDLLARHHLGGEQHDPGPLDHPRRRPFVPDPPL
jgi:hypothetical protein